MHFAGSIFFHKALLACSLGFSKVKKVSKYLFSVFAVVVFFSQMMSYCVSYCVSFLPLRKSTSLLKSASLTFSESLAFTGTFHCSVLQCITNIMQMHHFDI